MIVASSDPYAAVRDLVAALPVAKPGATMPEQVLSAVRTVLALYAEKDPGYAGSWSRRGREGVFHNVARKFDRIAAAFAGGAMPREDDIQDLATYAILQLAYYLACQGDYKERT